MQFRKAQLALIVFVQIIALGAHRALDLSEIRVFEALAVLVEGHAVEDLCVQQIFEL